MPARRVIEENSNLPLPPIRLAARVGVPAEADPLQFYLDEGRRLRGVIEGLLPDSWRWTGKPVLDFGCGAGIWEALIGSPYREDEVGMAVSRKWDGPAAWVFHSEWWLREHWGRGFEIQRVVRPPRTSNGQPEITHSYIALRKRDVELSADVLERIDPREHRELAGLQTSLQLAYRDVEYLGGRRAQLTPRGLCAAGLRSARLKFGRALRQVPGQPGVWPGGRRP